MVSEQEREYFEVSERIHLRRNIMERMYWNREENNLDIRERIHLCRNIIEKNVFGTEKRTFRNK